MKPTKKIKCFTVLLMMVLMQVRSQLTEQQLAKIAQNPLANIISVPFQNNINFGIGPFDRTQNILNIQPVIPMAEGKFIIRTILPIVNQPDILSETENYNGIGDISLSAFYTNNKGKISWGAGPIINLPTAGENLGIKEWGLGPSIVGVIKPGNWVIGVLINNVWSLESELIGIYVSTFHQL